MKRSEIWLVNLNPTVGAEIKKTRPAIIVSRDSIGVLPLKIVVPITDWDDRFEGRLWMVRLEPDMKNGLSKVSAAEVFQLKSASHERFVEQVGIVSNANMDEITNALAIVFGMKLSS